MADKLFVAGQYIDKFNTLTSQQLPRGPIMQSTGLEVHIKNHHPGLVSEMKWIPQIIAQPDYIGVNPSEPNSVELVRVLNQNLKVCIKLDRKDGYLFVASFYEMTEGKLKKHIKSGRLKPV